MKTPSLREKAAKFVYEADLTLNDETTVKELIDMMELYGRDVAREYYQKGIADVVLNRIDHNLSPNKSLE